MATLQAADSGNRSTLQEVLRRIRRIEIRARRLVTDLFLGEYHSVFRGRGIEFSEVREYESGDDFRLIDWNVSARMGYPYVKKFVEERELTVFLVVDVSGSGQFGTHLQTKSEIAAEVCALLALSAVQNNDRVGLLAFSDRVEKFLPARKGREHVLRLLRELLFLSPQGSGTDVAGALSYLSRVVRRRSVVFLVSDFLAFGFEAALRVVSRRHDVIAITVTDPRELELSSAGILELEDAETGLRAVVDSGDPRVRREYARLAAEQQEALTRLLRSVKVDQVDVHTDRSYVKPLMGFFQARARRG